MFNIRVSKGLNIQTGHTMWFLDNNRGFNSSNIISRQLNGHRWITGFTYIQRLDQFHSRCLGPFLGWNTTWNNIEKCSISGNLWRTFICIRTRSTSLRCNWSSLILGDFAWFGIWNLWDLGVSWSSTNFILCLRGFEKFDIWENIERWVQTREK